MESWTAVPMAAPIGTASSDSTTASTKTSASTRSLVRTNGLRPNTCTIGHRGKPKVDVYIAASSANELAVIR
jgi:hypothetical protein